jgi:hypothetical protein
LHSPHICNENHEHEQTYQAEDNVLSGMLSLSQLDGTRYRALMKPTIGVDTNSFASPILDVTLSLYRLELDQKTYAELASR